MHAQLRQDRLDVVANGVDAQVKLDRDARVRPSAGEQLEYFMFTLGQIGAQPVPAVRAVVYFREQTSQQDGRDQGLAGLDDARLTFWA